MRSGRANILMVDHSKFQCKSNNLYLVIITLFYPVWSVSTPLRFQGFITYQKGTWTFDTADLWYQSPQNYIIRRTYCWKAEIIHLSDQKINKKKTKTKHRNVDLGFFGRKSSNQKGASTYFLADPPQNLYEFFLKIGQSTDNKFMLKYLKT